jgi:heme/copper-type cytochrome/quinol oxidase subunit 2
MGAALAWPFLLPGNLACNVMGMGQTEYRDLVRMLINSLVWTAVAVLVVVLTV